MDHSVKQSQPYFDPKLIENGCLKFELIAMCYFELNNEREMNMYQNA